MTVYVNEFAAVQYGRFRQTLTPTPLLSYSLSSASTGPFPSAGCGYIRVTADAGSLVCVSTNSTATAPTSSNSIRVPGNVGPEFIAVSTSNRILVAST